MKKNKKAGLICHCGSHEVVYTNIPGCFRCTDCGSYGFIGAFTSEDCEENEVAE